MKTFKKVLSIVLDVLIVLILLVAVVFTIATVSASRNFGVGSIFGKSIFTVQSDSMSGTFEKGDVIIGNIYDYSAESASEIEFKKGDIITYRINVTAALNTHRIIAINADGTYQTQGDNEDTPDTNSVSKSVIVAYYPHVGELTGDAHTEFGENEIGIVGGLGNVIDFLKSPVGFIVCIVLPLLLFTGYEVYNFIISLNDYKKEKAKVAAMENPEQALQGLTEEEKQMLIAKYMESVKGAESQESDKKDDKTSEEDKT